MSNKKNDEARGRHAAPESEKGKKHLAEKPTGPATTSGPAAPAAAPEETRSRKPFKVLGIVLGVVFGLLLAAYAAGAIYFTGHFMPNTTIGDHDVSLKTADEVQDVLAASLKDYALSVSGQGFSLKLSARDTGLALDGKAITDSMLASVNPWLWPLEIARPHDESELLAGTYDKAGLGEDIRAAVEEFNAAATQPVDAVVAFSEEANAFVVQPEAVGTALDVHAVASTIGKAVATLKPSVKLAAEDLLKPTVLSTDPDLKKAADSANLLIKANMELTLGGTAVGAVNPALMATWVRWADDHTASLDEAALTAWVDELAAAGTTVGEERTYTRPDGKVITVSGGPYGWKVDRDALFTLVKEGVANGTVGTFDVPCTVTGTAYNGAGAQDWGARYCDIDLSEQYVRFYDEAGTLAWESACVSGTPNGTHNTPVGVFWLNQKASPSVLRGTNLDGSKYKSTVQYWMPFVGNVIGLHDADWQAAFGGSRYRNGFGSHGCVNLPPYLAASLYGIIQSGDVVVCHW